MISDLFFGGKLKDEENLILYEEEFVLFYIWMQLGENRSFKKEEIESILEKFYGRENIKNNGILKFCETNFIQQDKEFYIRLDDNVREDYNNARLFFDEINEVDSIDKNKLYNEIEKEVSNTDIKFADRLKKCLIYYCLDSNKSNESKLALTYRFLQLLKKYYEWYRIIDNKLEKIPELFNAIEVTELELSENQLSLLIFNNIFTLKNLKNMPVNSLICIFCTEIEEFINEIGKYTYSKKEILLNLKEGFNSIVKDEWAKVLDMRFAFNNYKRRTLAEIGNELNLTRERIRQIEKKAVNKLIECNKEIEKILYCFYRDINFENNNYITIEEFISYIGDEQLAKYLVIIMCSDQVNIRYDETYGIIYNKKETSIEDIINEQRDEIPDIIPVKDVEELNKIKKIIIDNEYRVYQEKIFVKKSINISAIYMNEIKENFVSGYDIGSDNDYNRLLNIVREKYGNIEMPSKRSVQAMIDRYDFIQIDRGKYLHREFASNLPEKLTDEILDYIISNSPIVAYNTIFEIYKNDLEKNGINNRFYLKGVLDEKLPEEFNTGRDFINTNSDNSGSLYDIMPQIFKAFDAEFTMDDIKEKMPGLNDYNYENYIRAEEEHGLIRIANRTYIYIDKLEINEEIKNELKEYIDNLFKALDSKILTAQKIYASLAIKNKELLGKLHITSRFGDFELYYIIKYLYKNEYYFSRPIISIEENFNTSAYVLAQEYVKRLERFNYGDVKSYLYKMNLGIIYSYLNFMEDMSENYVQFNKDSMIKKENLNISEEQLSKIHEFITIAITEKGLQTNNFDGYFMLPKLEKTWNKYLFVGIIRSYFNEEFEIENTTNYYDTTDFIIRRIK